MKIKIPKGSFMKKCKQYIHDTIMHSSISSTSLARLMPREIHADVNACVRYMNGKLSMRSVDCLWFTSYYDNGPIKLYQ